MTASKRRGGGEGSVYRDGDYWVATVEAGRHPTTGRRLRRKVKARTKAEVLRKAADARKAVASGVVTVTGQTLLGDFLDQWMTTVVAHRVDSPNTVACYAGILDRHVTPSLGKVPLSRLTPEMVDRFLSAKADAGLSRSYVGRMRSVLADALTHAERRSVVTRNAARLAVMPKCQPTPPRRSFTPAEARALLSAATGERLAALVVCGMTLGLRPGELTGLLWSDLVLDANPPTLTVSGSMKRRPDSSLYRGPVKRSTAGERTLAVPALLAGSLREHRRRQSTERLAAGPLWSDHGLVFPAALGTPLDPSNVRKVFARVARRAGIANVVPYLLRHTAASLLIDAGATIEEVADLLGDDPQTLYRHYRHRVRPVVDTAAERMEALFGPAAG